ncbi:MAG: polyprenyl synthetase family protein [Flavobacteriales bacterium]|nr:polyprenyl synthetase family protein [Flavobacteriales bacterium]
MNELDRIKIPVAEEMEKFEDHFRNAMRSDHFLLNKITHYVIKRKGKQMRPMFVFLCSKMCGVVNENTHTAASMIELLHTATLVHDDVVDDANMRRGFFSINALWKNKIAVLVGDYLLSRGLMISVEAGQFDLLRITSRAVQEMSEGELLQQEKSRLLNITEEVYYKIIAQKTASLVAACCESGAIAGGADEQTSKKLREFGLKVGLAFQLKDDLFDYGNGDIGKPTGIDIQERKMTLPLIYALQNANSSDRRRIINTVKNHNTEPKRVRELVQYVSAHGGLDYAVKKMKEFRNEAIAILETFPASSARESLQQLVDYTINREK